MKQLTFAIAIILLSGCSKNLIIGQYTGMSNPDSFQFSKDLTYTYGYNAFHLNEYSSGKWYQLNKRIIILNSFVENRNLEVRVDNKKVEVNNDYNLKLTFNSNSNLENYKCVIFINDTLYTLKGSRLLVPTNIIHSQFVKTIELNDLYSMYIRCDSLLLLKVNNAINSISFRVIKLPSNYSTQINKYALESKNTTIFDTENNAISIAISFSDSLFNYRLFRNEKLKISKRGIYIYNENSTKWWYIPKIKNRPLI
jgi:hypothetical protein